MRTPPHSLEKALDARVQLLATTLRPATVKLYRHTARIFVAYLKERCPDVRSPNQLRRDPHILGWLEHLWMRRTSFSGKPWCAVTRGAHVIRLRRLFDLLADHGLPPRPGLLISGDIPRGDQALPRPLTPEDDARLLKELRQQTTDLLANALLLTRLTGMRIGETADLSADCLRHLNGDQWALHVPIGKLHNERWVPVDEEVRIIVTRLLYLRTLPPAAPVDLLLPRPSGRQQLCSSLRATLSDAAAVAGITTHIVPHQLRHTYATALLRAGISLPALMKLLGHRTANMTLRYVQITQQDLQREFHLARTKPRHLLPVSSLSITNLSSLDVRPHDVRDRISECVRLMEQFAEQNPSIEKRSTRLLVRRLTRIRSQFAKLIQY